MKMPKIPLIVALGVLVLSACGEETQDDSNLAGSRDAVSNRDCRGGECAHPGKGPDGKGPDGQGTGRENNGKPEPKPWHPVGDEGWECLKIEDETIGADEIELSVGTATIWIDGWAEKDDSPNEWIGFSWTASGGPVSIRVKAGPEVFEADLEGESGTWQHPGGTEGPSAKAISNIVFCAPEDDEGGYDDHEDDETDYGDGDDDDYDDDDDVIIID